jgi:hypothetical protein
VGIRLAVAGQQLGLLCPYAVDACEHVRRAGVLAVVVVVTGTHDRRVAADVDRPAEVVMERTVVRDQLRVVEQDRRARGRAHGGCEHGGRLNEDKRY